MPVSKKSALLIVQNTSARCPFTLKETGTCAGARLAQFDKRANGQCYTITKYNLGASIMAKSTAGKPTTRQRSQTSSQVVRINGARVRLTTRNGKVTVKEAAPLEWELQAAQVRALRGLPEYRKLFLLAGDQNSAKRGPKAQAQAVAAGMTAGEADLRIYLRDGQVRHIENKAGNGRLSPAQVSRHAALAKLGHEVVVVRAVTEEDAAEQAVSLVRGWLADNELTAANENNRADAVKVA